MRVLVVNAGSSSLKLSVVEPDGTAAAHADITAVGAGVATAVVTAREDIEIARQTRCALAL